jgi:glycosyltransferase involved in cell wall biosynthesis
MNPVQIVADGAAGGGTTVVLGLIDDLLSSRGWRSTVVSQPGSHLERETQLRGLPFVPFDFFSSIFDPTLPWRLAAALRGAGRPLAHVHGLRAAHNALAWPARACLGPVLYTVHGFHHLRMPAPLRVLADLAERRAADRADRVVHVSQSDRRIALARGMLRDGSHGEVVLNGVAAAELPTVPDLPADWDVLFVGRLVPPKDPLRAARVLARLADSGHRCALAGGGPLRAECEALLAELPGGSSVVMTGALNRADSLAMIARTRLVLMTSLWEGLPLLPIEAMTLGVPVIAPALEGVAEVVADRVTGLLMPPDTDPSAWAAAAAALLADPARLSSYGAAGRDRARGFDRARGSECYARIYESIAVRGAAHHDASLEPYT